jgi:hypothetical protein
MWRGTNQGVLETWIGDERVVQILWCPDIPFLVDCRNILQLGPRPTARRYQVGGQPLEWFAQLSFQHQ